MKYIIVMMLMFLTGCSIVGPQERGVRLTAGKAGEVLESGPHLWFPVLYGIQTVNVSIQKSEIQTSAASKDLQEVTTTVAVNWSVTPDKVTEVYKTIGDEDEALSRIVTPAVNEILKSATAKKTAEEILTQRMELKAEIDKSLQHRLSTYGLSLSDVNIVNLHFSTDFTKAIENKQIAEQQSKQSRYLAEKAVNDAQAEVNRAKGTAESQKLLKATITPEILQKMWIEKWSGDVPQVVGNDKLMFNIPLNTLKK
jgi:prohibitin 1